MLRGIRRRLDRLWVAHQRENAAREAERARHGAHERFVATLRAGLTRAGIDPAAVPAMRRYDQPDPVMAASSPAPGRARGARELLYARLARIARHCREAPPALATATPMQLFAMYCFDGAAGMAPAG